MTNTNQDTTSDTPAFQVTSQTTRHLVFAKVAPEGIKLEYLLCFCCGMTSRQNPVKPLCCTNCERVYPRKSDLEWFNKGLDQPVTLEELGIQR